jgi:hypothetical protein
MVAKRRDRWSFRPVFPTDEPSARIAKAGYQFNGGKVLQELHTGLLFRAIFAGAVPRPVESA